MPANVANPLGNKNVIMGINAHAANFPGHPAIRQGLWPIRIDLEFGNAGLRRQRRCPEHSGQDHKRPAGQNHFKLILYSHEAHLFHPPVSIYTLILNVVFRIRIS